MPYPEEWVASAREELTSIGIKELRTAKEVEDTLGRDKGTVLVVVNSICGCAAANARPAVADALNSTPKPDVLTSVFAGQDMEATERARQYFSPQPPSSPSVALIRDGKLVFMLHRNRIEGRSSQAIADDLKEAFRLYCGVKG
ncbi:MAG TPA: BrxA/BrxB family bacilliredoxin [Acidobacteriota bacterium]|nr:BrxA/BrxB family bacilliredoxin [Acidobacteriota bacterium]